MKIIIEKNKCIGCASCAQVCPEVFEMREDGRAGLRGEEVTGKSSDKEVLAAEDRGCIEEAVEVCPVQCIIIKG